MKQPIRLTAIPNANDKQVFDLCEVGTTTTVWATLMRDIFYTIDRETYDALGKGKHVSVTLTAEEVQS
jgi:hypothetical protein